MHFLISKNSEKKEKNSEKKEKNSKKIILFLIKYIFFCETMSDLPPKKLLVYYAYPSSLNSAENQWDLDAVAADFAQYDLVILGAGLEDSSHGDHNNTKTILADSQVANVEFFGYIDTTTALNDNKTKIDNWKDMGGQLTGIFCDKFGYDWNNTRCDQNDLVQYIHDKSLDAFVNAWDPDDAFDGTPAPKLGSSDWFLAESYQIIDGDYETETAWTTRSDKMVDHRDTYGTKMACITTTNSTTGYDAGKWDYAYFSCALYGFDACGWGEPNFSASDAVAPFRTRKAITGSKTHGSIAQNGSKYEINTNVGIHVDASNHTVSTSL